MKRVTLFIIALLFSGLGAVHAQDTETPTPITVVVTVVLVYPSATPTLTPTDGPTPTPTFTPSPTPNSSSTYYGDSGEDVTLVREVRPGEAATVGLLVVIAGLLMAHLFWKMLKGEK